MSVHASTISTHGACPRGASAEEAMSRFADGDEAAFARVYGLCARRVFALLCRLAREPGLAEDLTQETFVRMVRARSSYRRGELVLPWAFTIARRLCVDRVRRARFERDERASIALAFAPLGAARPDEAVTAARMAAAVDAVLARIPPKQAEAFRLMRGEGLSALEASARLGDTPLSMRLRTHRASEAIRRELGDGWETRCDRLARRAPSARRDAGASALH